VLVFFRLMTSQSTTHNLAQ